MCAASMSVSSSESYCERSEMIAQISRTDLSGCAPSWLKIVPVEHHERFMERERMNLVIDKDLMDMPYWALPRNYLSWSERAVFESLRTCLNCRGTSSIEFSLEGECLYHAKESLVEGYSSICRICDPTERGSLGSAKYCRQSPCHDFGPVNDNFYAFWTDQVVMAPLKNSESPKRDMVCFDCEMVEVRRADGSIRDEIITLSMVDVLTNEILLNQIVEPDGEIIDFRGDWTGFDVETLSLAKSQGKTVSGLRAIQDLVLSFIDSETIVAGFAVSNDIAVLKIAHTKLFDPQWLRWARCGKSRLSFTGLKGLANSRGWNIQQGAHGSLEDTLATAKICRMELLKHDCVWFDPVKRAQAAEEARRLQAEQERIQAAAELACARVFEEATAWNKWAKPKSLADDDVGEVSGKEADH